MYKMIMYKWKVVVTAVTFAKADPEPLRRLQAIGCEVITNSLGRPLAEGEMINAAQDADALIVGKLPDLVFYSGNEKLLENC